MEENESEEQQRIQAMLEFAQTTLEVNSDESVLRELMQLREQEGSRVPHGHNDDDDDDGDDMSDEDGASLATGPQYYGSNGGFEDDESCMGLFDDALDPSGHACLERAKTAYGFDLHKLAETHQLDFYGKMRVINWIRAAVAQKTFSAEQILAQLSENWERFHHDDSLLIPQNPSDPLLRAIE